MGHMPLTSSGPGNLVVIGMENNVSTGLQAIYMRFYIVVTFA